MKAHSFYKVSTIVTTLVALMSILAFSIAMGLSDVSAYNAPREMPIETQEQ